MTIPTLDIDATESFVGALKMGNTLERYGASHRRSFIVVGRTPAKFRRNDFPAIPQHLEDFQKFAVDGAWTTVSRVHCVIYVYARKLHLVSSRGASVVIAQSGDFMIDGLMCRVTLDTASATERALPSLDDLIAVGAAEALRVLKSRLSEYDSSFKFDPPTSLPGTVELTLGDSTLRIVWTKTQYGPMWRVFNEQLQAFADRWRVHHRQARPGTCALPGTAGHAVRQLHDDDVVVAARDGVPLLVLGETGVGKSRIARCYHQHSARAEGRYVEFDCGMFGPDETRELRAKLFGAKKGAWNGLDHDIEGAVELANGGVLFLDEVGDLKPDLQSLLLRFIQEGTYSNYNETRLLRADVRLVFATNHDLGREAFDETFREDLYYRMTIGRTITLPPLRERRDELEALLQHEAVIPPYDVCPPVWPMLTPEARRRVLESEWRGNFRAYERFRLAFPRERPAGSVALEECERHLSTKDYGKGHGAQAPSLGDLARALRAIDAPWRAQVLQRLDDDLRKWNQDSENEARTSPDPGGDDPLKRLRAIHDALPDKRGHKGQLTALGAEFLVPVYVAWRVAEREGCSFDALPNALSAELAKALADELLTMGVATVREHYRRFLELWRSARR